MIKADQLKEVRKDTVYKEGKDITLLTLQKELKETAEKYQIQIAFTNDQIKSGGMFNSTTVDCLVVYHPKHPTDYFRYAVSIRRQGVMAYVSVNYFGSSKQTGKAGVSKDALSNLKEGNLGTAMLGGLMSLGKNKNKLEEENNFYSALDQIIDEVIS